MHELLDLADGDDVGFIHAARAILEGQVRTAAPAELYVVKIENWFGPRWLGFSHKLLGAAGVAHRKTLRVPPFVPSRVVSQRYWRKAASAYVRDEAPLVLHIAQPSAANARRTVVELCPAAALIWWSGDTRRNGRGALMAYTPGEGGVMAWYAELDRAHGWRPVLADGIAATELLRAASPHASPR